MSLGTTGCCSGEYWQPWTTQKIGWDLQDPAECPDSPRPLPASAHHTRHPRLMKFPNLSSCCFPHLKYLLFLASFCSSQLEVSSKASSSLEPAQICTFFSRCYFQTSPAKAPPAKLFAPIVLGALSVFNDMLSGGLDGSAD